MYKKYKVVFYAAEPARYCVLGLRIKKDIKIEDVVEAESKSDALMKIAQDFDLYEFVSVERVK